MKVVILAGGFGTRLSEETNVIPKPMIEIGGYPILWHIMKIYSAYGFNDFIVCLGYKGYKIKEFFVNYFVHNNDLTVDLKNNKIDILNNNSVDWKVKLIDTGYNTMTGGRLLRVKKYVGDETFMFTYGDGVSDINLKDLIRFHEERKKAVTVTAVQPPGRFGSLALSKQGYVKSFHEKPIGDGRWISGGFFVLEPEVFNYIEGDTTTWENEPLKNLTKDGKVVAFRHTGFWKSMDTLRDKNELEFLWETESPPWKVWK